MPETPRLHQSIGKILVSECPAVGKAAYDAERREPTRAMERGTLVDQLVFGGANFHEIDAPDYRKKAVQEERYAARAKGMVPILSHELEPAKAIAGIIKSKLLEEGIDLDKAEKQKTIQWQGEAGCPCEGTPDLILGRDTIDLKCGHTANPDRLEYHLHEQGWHFQGAAYQEAVGLGGNHWLVCAELKSGANCVTVCQLSPAFLDIGRRSWLKAQRIWMRGWETGEWPEYTGRVLLPPKSVLIKEGLSS